MIVSHRHKFIFVKTLKSAGTSIELALAHQCGPEDVVTPIFPRISGHRPRNWRGWFVPWREVRRRGDLRKNVVECLRRDRLYNHIPARFARARLTPKIWDSYLKICVDRNPWDKTLSHFHMFKHAKWHRHYDPDLTLDAYLEKQVFCHNAPFYCDARGRPIVDKILRYDRLEAELADLCADLGMPFEGLPKAKAGLRTDRRSYRDVFTPQQAETIGTAFAHEISLLGWEY